MLDTTVINYNESLRCVCLAKNTADILASYPVTGHIGPKTLGT